MLFKNFLDTLKFYLYNLSVFISVSFAEVHHRLAHSDRTLAADQGIRRDYSVRSTFLDVFL